MPNTSDLNVFVVPGEDVKDGDTITFVDGGKWHTYDDGRKTIQILVECPGGKIKTVSLNNTSAKNLSESYGGSTEDWQGKRALVSVVKMNVRGTVKNVLYLYPVQ